MPAKTNVYIPIHLRFDADDADELELDSPCEGDPAPRTTKEMIQAMIEAAVTDALNTVRSELAERDQLKSENADLKSENQQLKDDILALAQAGAAAPVENTDTTPVVDAPANDTTPVTDTPAPADSTPVVDAPVADQTPAPTDAATSDAADSSAPADQPPARLPGDLTPRPVA